MHFTTTLLGFAATALAQTGTFPSAPVQSGNPLGASYSAVLPAKAGTNVRGSVIASTAPGGIGVTFAVSISGLPSSGGPFIYHIHQKPVPADGNCTATLAHLDPLNRGEDPPCDASAPATCQVGDLAGKHGSMPGPTYSSYYTDPYVSTVPGNAAFFGDKSIVVHFANKTRINCANFTAVTQGYNGTTSGTGSGSANPTGITTYTPPGPTIVTGAAAMASVSVLAALVGVAALLL